MVIGVVDIWSSPLLYRGTVLVHAVIAIVDNPCIYRVVATMDFQSRSRCLEDFPLALVRSILPGMRHWSTQTRHGSAQHSPGGQSLQDKPSAQDSVSVA